MQRERAELIKKLKYMDDGDIEPTYERIADYIIGRERKLLGRIRKPFMELHAMVKGECPSLLNEDSGGNAQLDMEIDEALSEIDRAMKG